MNSFSFSFGSRSSKSPISSKDQNDIETIIEVSHALSEEYHSKSKEMAEELIPVLDRRLFAWEEVSWGVDHYTSPIEAVLAKYMPSKWFLRYKKHKKSKKSKHDFGESPVSSIDLTIEEPFSMSHSDYISTSQDSLPRFINTGQTKSTHSIKNNMFYKSVCDDLPSPPSPIKEDYIQEIEEEIPFDILILDNISGYIHAGEMTAILGASGAGKTTLLTTLSGRNNNFRGNLKINGEIVSSSVMRNVCRYVQQFDRFFETLKVEEHIYFQARLRLKDKSEEEIQERVEWIMHELGLVKCRNTIIGGVKKKGISGGEMRRLTLASQVIDFPSVILCDEPTSGLDSFMAECVIRFLKLLSDHGAAVLCTIHQPPYEVFSLFDNACFLDEGRVAYFGKVTETVSFFQNNFNKQCPQYCNPADFSIGLLAVDPRLSDGDRQKIREEHKANAIRYKYIYIYIYINYVRGHTVDETIDLLNIKDLEEGHGNWVKRYIQLTLFKKCSTGWMNQFLVLLDRSWKVAIRDDLTVKGRAFQMVFLAVIVGIVFLRLGFSQVDIQNRLGVIFFIMMDLAFGLVFATIQVFPLELNIFFPEYASGLYRVDTYYLAKSLVDLPFQIIFPVLFTCIVYYLVGLDPDFSRFLGFTGILLLVTNATLALGYFISCLSPTMEFASAMTAIIILPFVLLGGFFLNDDTVPVYLIWLSEISMFKWGFKLLLINQFAGKTFVCPPEPEPCLYPDGAAVLALNDTTVGEVALCIMMLIIINIGFRVGGFFVLSFRAYLSLEKF
ncbi:hypothetical protein WA158_004941 [Blastocystis sp. Blastoise]